MMWLARKESCRLEHRGMRERRKWSWVCCGYITNMFSRSFSVAMDVASIGMISADVALIASVVEVDMVVVDVA